MSDTCYTFLIGGLGNQMFEIAAGYAHARRTGRTLQLPGAAGGGRGTYWRTFLHKCAPFVTDGGPPSVSASRLWKEPHFHYKEIPRTAAVLHGYFQSSRYFNDISGEIRTLFDPHPVIKTVMGTKYATFLTEESRAASCIVHVRRTDFLAGANRPIHAVCDKAWYGRALAEMDRQRAGQPTRYLVFSDDIEWCRAPEQADLWAGRDVAFIDERNDCVTLHLMSQFRAFVISNSTFSWWATWLQADPIKTVVAPARWFGPGGPQDWEDIYEPGWIRLP